MNKRKAIFGLALSLGLLFSMGPIKENTSANAGWAIAKYAFKDHDVAHVVGQAAGATLGGAGATLGGAGAAWTGATIVFGS